jgi:predicted dithiol-disulfide oxidoreductase (DUF899 family)
MSLPKIVSRQEWLASRKALLAREKKLMHEYDALNEERRRLPMVKIEKDYRFSGPGGSVRFIDLFQGRRQLVVYHFMFDPGWEAGCPGCTAVVDEIAPGLLAHLHSRDTSYVLVSRAPFEKIERYRAARGWTAIDWYSSNGSDFNYDFHVTFESSVAPLLFNYRTPDELADTKDAWAADPANQPVETSGLSFFLRDGDDVFHTYSTYQRGTEAVDCAYRMLDLSALGRQEDWEEPKGRAEHTSPPDASFGGGLV